MKFTVISCVYGNLSVVKECMDSWFPLPKTWSLVVYNSSVSNLDGTTEYLKKKQTEENFTIIEDGQSRTHSSAVRTILPQLNANWVLHLDSDAKLLNPAFYRWMDAATTIYPKYKVWGKITRANVSPKIDTSSNPEKSILRLPRCHQWLLLFNRRYLLDSKITFDEVWIDGKIESNNANILSRDGYLYNKDDNIKILGDVGWQIFCNSFGDGLFSEFPDEVYKYWSHLNNKTCEWERSNLEFIKKSGITKLE